MSHKGSLHFLYTKEIHWVLCLSVLAYRDAERPSLCQEVGSQIVSRDASSSGITSTVVYIPVNILMMVSKLSFRDVLS
jgi:hypothetical protein